MSGRDGLRPDTIAAPATPPGVSALAVVRMSGPSAFPILRSLAPEEAPLPGARRATLLELRDPASGELLDRALVTTFPAPDSYTGEDVVEISGHGGFLSSRLLLEACTEAGAREAEPGEFTRRAYLNGKMDLVQAEAVADLIEGRSRALRRASLAQLDRGLSRRVAGLREAIVELEALLTHHLDFPDEDEAPVPLERVMDSARDAADRLESLLATAAEGELLREGAVAVLAGRPNSGKSSLFNALLGRDRAIVTEVPGTTRDALEAVVAIGGFPFRLVDTAGLRESDDRVESLGIEVARRYLDEADVILFCAEAGRPLDRDEAGFLSAAVAPTILVRTQADRVGSEEAAGAGAEETEMEGSVEVSAHTGEGLAALRKLLPGLVYRGLVSMEPDAPVVTRARQARGVERALDEIRGFGEALAGGVPAEVAATHLRAAESALEEVLGVIPGDEVLDRVFREFCIGK